MQAQPLYEGKTEECFLNGLTPCRGRVMNRICEEHALELFRIAMR